MTPFGILFPETFLWFTESKVTTDFMADCLGEAGFEGKDVYGAALPGRLRRELDEGFDFPEAGCFGLFGERRFFLGGGEEAARVRASVTSARRSQSARKSW